jgi:general secretion pathway protein J
MRRSHSRGITLIEVLVALAILSMMVASVWTGFRTTVRGMKSTEAVQQRYNSVRNALNTMANEVSTSYLSFNRRQGEVRHFTYFEGREEPSGDTLTFSSFAHLRLRLHSDESDQSVIQYVLDDDPEDGKRKHLFRRESRRLAGDRPEDLYKYDPAYVLLENVKTLEFRYWDPLQEEWREEWATMQNDAQPDRLPPRVEIKIGIENNIGEEEFFVTQVVLPMQEKVDLAK